MNALVVSLKFNPGHFSHLCANYWLMEELGYTSYLYIHPSFNEMDVDNRFRKINTWKNLEQLQFIDVAVFWFPSLKNIFEIQRLKSNFGSKIIYVYHEPFDSIVNYYRSGFGLTKIFKIYLINIVNVLILMMSDRVILPSPSAFLLYKKKYNLVNKQYSMIPLLFDDENKSFTINTKKYISYIGTVAADHAFDKFVDFVKTAVDSRWLIEVDFLIATSSHIADREREIIQPILNSGRLKIVEGKFMKNEEINIHYRDSFLVWNAYHRSMQSGVLPKAYMFGAAVVVLYRNSSIFIDNNETGILIHSNSSVEEIKLAIEEVLIKKQLFQEKCRSKFLNTFFYRSYLDDFRILLNI